jgi:hypothetical protein
MSEHLASAGSPMIGRALSIGLRRRARLLGDREYWRLNTRAIQLAQLRGLLERAADTEFGREHAFGRIARLGENEMLEAYRASVPIADWHAFKSALERMRDEAEPDVLWPGVVRNFAQSSGTTAGEKHLPVSDALLKSNRKAAVDLFATAIRFGASLPRLTGGKLLFLGGSTTLEVNEHGIRTGDLSGIVVPMIRWPMTKIYEPGPDVALMSHWPSKIERIVDRCMDMDVRMVNGVPSWICVLFERLIERARARGRDVSCVRDVWPNLMLFVHGGVRYEPFDLRVRRLFSGDARAEDIPFRLEVYPASEAFIALQETKGERSLRLLSDIDNFYEFTPVEDAANPGARAYAVDEVEKGVAYAVTMSTCAGLWRYVIGDVVEFDTIPGEHADGPASLRIVGRLSHFINAFGEHVIVEHVESAVAEASRATGLEVGEFTAAPVFPEGDRRGGLELAIELEVKSSDRSLLDRFGIVFDEGIKRLNLDYTTKRTDDTGMAPPTITPVPAGTFNRWMESRGKLGGQHKCPRCANTRQYIDDLLRLAANQPRIDRPAEAQGKEAP